MSMINVGNNTILTGDYGGILYQIDFQTLKEKQALTIGAPINLATKSLTTNQYILATDGGVYCVLLKNKNNK